MKYIKLFEGLPTKHYSIQDFIDIPYWKYKNSGVDSIMKVEFLDNDKLGKWNSDYKFTFFNLKDSTFFDHIDKNNFLYQIMNLEVPKKILRPATDEEIELFKGNFLTKKYNL